MPKKIIALIICSIIAFNINLKAQDGLIWRVELNELERMHDAIILQDEEHIVNTYRHPNEKINKLQLRDFDTGEIVHEKEFDFDIRSVIQYSENTLFITGPGIVALIDSKTFNIKADYYHLFEDIDDFTNINKSAVKHPFKNQIMIPILIDSGPQYRQKAFILDIDKLEVTKIPNEDGYNWTQCAYSSDGKYYAISIENHPFLIRLYEAETNELIKVYENNLPEGSEIEDLKFSPSSNYLCAIVEGDLISIDIKNNIVYEAENSPNYDSFQFINDNEIIGASGSKVRIFNILNDSYRDIQKTKLERSNYTSITSNFNNILEQNIISLSLSKIDIYKSIEQKQETLLYPNPAVGVIKLQENKLKEVRIYNQKGQEYLLPQVDYTINISHLEIGVYFVNIDNKTYKIIKE